MVEEIVGFIRSLPVLSFQNSQSIRFWSGARNVARWIVVIAAWSTSHFHLDAADFEMTLGVKPGMQYDIPRFAVSSGDSVAIRFVNEDEMAHNVVFTQPGARVVVVTAAMALGVDGLSKGFVPESEDILSASGLLNPDEEEILEFMAPDVPGVYPYVCTFPGHGFLMYGAMYVGVEMPDLAQDLNLPPMARSAPEPSKSLHAWGEKRPLMYRIFMPDAGPAAIAVALQHGQSYCWDAGGCWLRYAWQGGFVDPWPVWQGNGNGLARIEGKIYWRGGEAHPLRIGDPDVAPTVDFLGYRKVDRYPVFSYRVNGILVEEGIRENHHGGGLKREFKIESTDEPIMFVASGTGQAAFSSSYGAFKNDRLLVDATNGAEFEITMTPITNAGGEQ